MKPKILILNPFLKPLTNLLAEKFTLIPYWEDHFKVSAKEIVGLASCVWDKVDEELMNALPNLKMIAHLATGTDAVNLTAAKSRNITVTNTPDVVTQDTADLAFGLLINLSRQINRNDQFVKSGMWLTHAHPLTTSLSNKNLGIVGLGKIGLEVAKRAEAFRLNIYYHARHDHGHERYHYIDQLKTLAEMSDYLVITCTGHAETRGLIHRDILESLGPQGFLINISRGFVVNQNDLIEALIQQKIAGAGLDVFEDEPNVPEVLFQMNNVILQPHVGSATLETRATMFKLLADNIIHFFQKGIALTPVN